MKKIKLILTLLIGLSAVVACKKDDPATSAVIEFIEPTATDTISAGDELHAEGTIIGNNEMHGYSLKMVNETTNEVLVNTTSSSHASSYAFHEHWVNNVTQNAVVAVTITANLDDAGNQATKTLKVVCLP